MGRFIITGLAALGIIGAHAPIAAQDAPRPLKDHDIEVSGDRPLVRDEIVRGQHQIYANGLPYRTALRFHDPICVAVVGFEAGQNEMIAERIRGNIRDAGIALADASCKPNALLSANRDPAAVIKALKGRDPQLFSRASEESIRSQLAAGKPAIAWGETAVRANDGMVMSGMSATDPSPVNAYPVYTGPAPSRLRAPLYESKVNAIVFLDMDRLEEMHVHQVADYATLHLLGTPRDPADYEAAGVPTILSLFTKGPRRAPIGMTALDRAYLRGLYQLRSTDWAWRLTANILQSYQTPGGGAQQQDS